MTIAEYSYFISHYRFIFATLSSVSLLMSEKLFCIFCSAVAIISSASVSEMLLLLLNAAFLDPIEMKYIPIFTLLNGDTSTD